MKEKDSGTDDQVTNPHYVESEGFLEKQSLPEGTRKVLTLSLTRVLSSKLRKNLVFIFAKLSKTNSTP